MVVLRENGELESDEPMEEFSFEELNCSYSSPPTTYSPPRGPTSFPYFPPSPTYFPVSGPTSFPPWPPSFPLDLPASPPPPSSSTSCPIRVRAGVTLFHDFQNQQHEDVVDLPVVDLTLFVDYRIEERGGELNVINGLEGSALNVINGLEGSAMEGKNILLEGEVDELEHQHEDIIDQLVIDYAGVDHYVIGYWGNDVLDVISRGGVFTLNGVEFSLGQALSTTPEPSVVIYMVKLSLRLWLGHRGQWVADIRYGWNWLNLGTFRTAEGPLAAEFVKRWRGGKDLFDYPGPFLIENGSEPLQLPPTAQEENQDDGIGSEGTGDCAMADQAQFNSGCSKKRKTRKKNLEEEERNEKAKGVRIEIPLDDILQRKGMRIEDAANDLEVSKSTLKRICREYGIDRWPPRKEQELVGQSRPNKSPAVVDQEQIPQLNLDTLLPSNQVPATSDTCSVKVKVKCEEGTIIKFQLSSPWQKIELEQEVKKRLPFEAGTYNIKYKDEDDELILISCDEDLAECISSSSPVGSRSIELFLKLK